jgi:hypothetical protein
MMILPYSPPVPSDLPGFFFDDKVLLSRSPPTAADPFKTPMKKKLAPKNTTQHSLSLSLVPSSSSLLQQSLQHLSLQL